MSLQIYHKHFLVTTSISQINSLNEFLLYNFGFFFSIKKTKIKANMKNYILGCYNNQNIFDFSFMILLFNTGFLFLNFFFRRLFKKYINFHIIKNYCLDYNLNGLLLKFFMNENVFLKNKIYFINELKYYKYIKHDLKLPSSFFYSEFWKGGLLTNYKVLQPGNSYPELILIFFSLFPLTIIKEAKALGIITLGIVSHKLGLIYDYNFLMNIHYETSRLFLFFIFLKTLSKVFIKNLILFIKKLLTQIKKDLKFFYSDFKELKKKFNYQKYLKKYGHLNYFFKLKRRRHRKKRFKKRY